MAKKIIRLTESDLTRIVKRILMEGEMNEEKIISCIMTALDESEISLEDIPQSCMTLIESAMNKDTSDPMTKSMLTLECTKKCYEDEKLKKLPLKIPSIAECALK